MNTHSRLQRLRHLLYADPSPQSWAALCQALDQWPHQEAALALDYAGEHLQSWPGERKAPPAHWRLARLYGKPLPWWPLASPWHVLVLSAGESSTIPGIKKVREVLALPLKTSTHMHLHQTPYLLAFALDEASARRLHQEVVEAGAQALLLPDGPELPQRWPQAFSPQELAAQGEALRNPMVGALLAQARLYRYPLQGMDFSQTRLSGLHLEGLDLREAQLQSTMWYRMDMSGLDLRGADLRDIRWDNNVLEGCDLRGATLRGAHLSACSMRRVQLQGADLRDATLGCYDLHTSQVLGCIYNDVTYWPQGFSPPPSAPF